MKKILLILALLLSSSPLYAQDYYVCDTGDDTNDGLTINSPFQSYEKAMSIFATISGGDSVLLCRGGQFPITTAKKTSNQNCSVSSVCTLGDYGDKQADKPKIIAQDGMSPLSFYGPGNKPITSGYIIKNISLLSTANSGVGVFIYDRVSNLMLDNLHIQGFGIGLQIAAKDVDTVTLKNSVIINNASQGTLGACSNCLFEGNYFESNGSGTRDHNIYLGSIGGIVENMVVRGNTLYKSSMKDGKCDGVSLVAHGKFEGLTIENNLVKENAGNVNQTCYGISVDPGYAYDEYFKNVVIRGNTLLNLGGNAIGCASCDGALIENNTIIDEGSVLVHGISVPVRTEDTVKSKNITIRNNKILLTKNWNETSGVRVGGFYPMTVDGNVAYLADYDLAECVRASDASIDIDTTSNTCNKTVTPDNLAELIDEIGGLPDVVGPPIVIEPDDPVEPPTSVEPWPYSTTKAQITGLATQLENLMNNANNTVANDCGDTAAVLRSIADLLGKNAEVVNELDIIKQLVKDTD